MLNKHDPPILGFHEIEDLFYLCAGVTEPRFHDLFGDMSLLVRKQDNSAALNIGAFERLDSAAKPIVKNTEADNTAFVSVSHVSALVLSSAA